MTKHYRTVCTL